MYCKTHETGGSRVLACADENILGKTFSGKDIEVTVKESFYRGEKIGEERLAELLKEHDSINLFGEKSVGVAVKQGLLSGKDIIRIQGVMHAIILKV